MTYGKVTDTTYLIRLERGEEVVATLKSFCLKENIKNGEVRGIGSIETPTLAHYRVDNKKYSEKELPGTFEVTSLLGTVALANNEALLHLHITLGNEQMQSFGGHLVKGIVSATLEMTLTVYPSEFSKSHSEEIGLNLYDLPEKHQA